MKITEAKIKKPSEILERKFNLDQKSNTVNIFNERNKGEYYLLDTEQLVPFHNQSRIHFDDKSIEELSKTIENHGIRQPLTVIKSQKYLGKYEIISGERRYRAALNIKLPKIPCIILENGDSADEVALIENIQREDLHPIELGRAYTVLYKNAQFDTHQKISDKFGIPRSQVTEYMSYAKFDEEESMLLIKNHIADRESLRKIAAVTVPEERQNYINDLINYKPKLSNSDVNQTFQKKIIRSSNILSLSLKDGKLEVKHKPFEKLNLHEREETIIKLKEILNKVEGI